MHDYRGLLAGWPGILQIHSVSVFLEFLQVVLRLTLFGRIYRYNVLLVLHVTFNHL